MHGDQLSRQCQAIRPIVAKPIAFPPNLICFPPKPFASLRLGERHFHAKAQRAPREICWTSWPSLKVFPVPLPDLIENKVKKNPMKVFASLRLGERQFHAKPQRPRREISESSYCFPWSLWLYFWIFHLICLKQSKGKDLCVLYALA
jgi:hypothetical protein